MKILLELNLDDTKPLLVEALGMPRNEQTSVAIQLMTKDIDEKIKDTDLSSFEIARRIFVSNSYSPEAKFLSAAAILHAEINEISGVKPGRAIFPVVVNTQRDARCMSEELLIAHDRAKRLEMRVKMGLMETNNLLWVIQECTKDARGPNEICFVSICATLFYEQARLGNSIQIIYP